MPHYTAVTRNREHGKGGGVAILLRHDLAYTEIDDIQLTSTTDNEQLTVAIRIDSNRELYVSIVYCPHANPSVELIDGLCENRDQIILTGDFNSKHPELGNDQTKPSGTRLATATQNNNLTFINDGTPTFLTRLGKEDVNDLIFISQSIIPNFRDFWVGDDHGLDHFIINGVFSYTPIYNEMNEKTVGNDQTKPSGTLATATQNRLLPGWERRMSTTSFSSRNQSSLISGIFGWEMTMA